jgi:hypothetical protein
VLDFAMGFCGVFSWHKASFSYPRLQITSDLVQIVRVDFDGLRSCDEKILDARF